MPSRISDALHWYATYESKRTAIVSEAGSLTYAALWSRVCRLANSLSRIGVRPGDRIAVLMQNSNRYLEIYNAAALMGVAVVPLNFQFVADEVEYVTNHSGARALVYDPAFSDTVASIRARLPSVEPRYIVTDGPERDGTYSYEKLVETGADVAPNTRPDLAACYFQGYTSGTTGFPKGCVNPHREFLDCMRRSLRYTASRNVTARSLLLHSFMPHQQFLPYSSFFGAVRSS